MTKDKYGSCYFHPDETLLHVVINNLYARHPEKFGTEETRQSLHHAIASKVEATRQIHGDTGHGANMTILPPLAALFEAYEISAFADVRMAFLGCNETTLKNAQPIIKSMKAFADFHPERTEVRDCGTWEKHITGGKYDYALTGNVLNDPHFSMPSYAM